MTVTQTTSTSACNDSSLDTVPGSVPLTEKIIESVILTAICLVSITGNVFLWVVVVCSRKLRTTSNALVLCLSGADLMVSIANMPITVVTIVYGEWVLGSAWCSVFGFTSMVNFIASVMSLGAISVNRFILISYPHHFRSVYNKKGTAAMILGVWLLACCLASPPLFGWAEYDYLPNQSFCFCKWRSSISYTVFMIVLCFGGPCCIMLFSYASIWNTVRRSRQRVEANNAKEAAAIDRERVRRKREEDMKLTKLFLVVIAAFVLAWLPFCITMVLGVVSPNLLSPVVEMTTLLLGYCNSCCNPIIYGVMNRRFTEEFMATLCIRGRPGDNDTVHAITNAQP
ncbi:5-hydroxytryptamine receptor 7-like [Saccoglossus kowalevskii]|uniref:Octopamine receptor 1-like n=1 Tax=Saccoglossus kowalevskii TaxID=10224 RepID=A0ABM0GJE0_SACKO|nr:PREDICTED: octopamine receptor 1-like [Saccoglossus kowalevskii]